MSADLATLSDLGRRWGVSRQRVHELAALPDFPEPVATVGRNGRQRLWDTAEIERWRERRMKAWDRRRRGAGP